MKLMRVRPAPGEAHDDHHHRDVKGGAARAAVFGMSDGLVSNVSLILGFAGADAAPRVVRLAGLAGLLAGALSMAAGEYVSVQAQRELLQRELDIERRELERRPEPERRELAGIYRSRGVAPDLADRMASELSTDLDSALAAHAREELGIDPTQLGSPPRAAISSLLAFAVGALVPLLPWFMGGGTAAKIASVVLGLAGALALGVAVAVFTDQRWPRPVLRQLGFAVGAASLTYVIGSLVGTGAVG